MTLSIQLITRDNLRIIRKLAATAFPETYQYILSVEQLDYMFDMMYSLQSLRSQIDGGHVFYLIYKDNIACGYFSIEKQDTSLFHLQKLYILPSIQGCGAGRFAFDQIINIIKQLQPHRCYMELNVNRHNHKAIKFYEQMGMKCVKEGDFDIGKGYFMNDYIMRIEL